jgi:hypothetical protein
MSSLDLESHHFYKPFTATIAGFILPCVNGLISACSSAVILHVIRKSQDKFSTTYHRIMGLMSFFDIILSLLFALGTIMMPSDTFYKFAGPTLGNRATCQAQGWLIIFGFTGSTAMYAALSWYFMLTITFNVKASKIACIFEPVAYLYTFCQALIGPSVYLSKDLLNPNPYDIFCTIAPYPQSCDEEKWYDWNYCEWAENAISDYNFYMNVTINIMLFTFIMIVLGFSVILWTVFQKNKLLKALLVAVSEEPHECDNTDSFEESNLGEASNYHQEDERRNEESDKMNHINDLKYSRVLIIQALMYIFAYFLTWFFNFLSGTIHVESFGMDAVNSILFPLQGFWNLFIFLYDKTYLIRARNPNTSFWAAVKMILFHPTDVPVLIMSNISMIVIEPRDEVNDIEEDARISQIESTHDGIPKQRGGFIVASVASGSIDDLLLNILEQSTSSSSPQLLQHPTSTEHVCPNVKNETDFIE